ncbi:MAG: phenylalanine--tRNA ligase subunit beta, partial [Proteobacteria bacterium]|nr:phenylalanine--tRNA ligase subunit beta [Pseudomonadota bacterium]
TYALCEDDIVIADERPVAIAGVMGGAETEVSEGTGRILLEVAAFSPTQVRKTAKRLGLHSESSHRFERFVDAEGITRAVSRAIWLLGQAQNAPIRVTAVHDCRAVSHVARKLTLRSARVSDVLGVTLNAEVLSRILQPIGFVADDWSLPQIELTVPSWRSDVTREIDIIEEICRGYGVDNLTAAMPEVALEAVHVLRPVAVNPTAYPVVPTIWDRKDRKNFHDLREALMAAGLHECMHYTFMDPSDPKRLCFPSDVRESKPIRLTNPMSAEQSAMRTTLLPGMLKALKTNVAQQQKHCALFELGDVFFTVQQGNLTVAESVPHLCVMMWGEPEKAWFAAPRAYDVYDVKGVLASAFGELGYHMQCEQVDKAVSWLHDGVQARIVFEGRTIGYFGELHPVAAKRHKLDGPVFLAHIDISSLLASHQPHQRVSPLARFPHSTRDQSMVVSADVTFEQIESIVESVRPETLESWRIFDVYRGKQITPGMQSISLTFRYRHPLAHDIELGQTLTDDEVNRAHEVIVTTLLSALGSQIR